MENQATIDELRKILFYISKGYKLPKIIHDVIFRVAKYEIEEKKKVVLIKRDPNIHSGRIQAVYVRIIEGEAMDIHPATVGGFGADFDGDTMSVFVPLSKEAQTEAKTKMVRAISNSSINSPNFNLTNEMLIGLFTLTHENANNPPKIVKSMEEIVVLHPGIVVTFKFKGESRTTTAGRFVFNSKLPPWYSFIDEPIKKKNLGIMFTEIVSRSKSDYAVTIDAVMKLAFEIATKYPRSISLDMLRIPPQLMKLKEKLAKEKDMMVQQEIIDDMTSEMIKHLQAHVPELYDILESGASKGYGQLRQLMIAKGLFSDAEGNILPVVARSMNEGYRPGEYFNAAGGARKGIVNRVHTTAHGGYAYRKMVYVMGNAQANPTNKDCETRLTMKIKLTPDLFRRMKGRYVQDTFGGPFIPVDKSMIGKVINLRSPMFCRSLKICRTCYGQLIDQVDSRNVGLIAAQECTSLSEKIMKSFHTGGAVDLKRPDIIKMLLENISDDMESIVKKAFQQEDMSLVSNAPFVVVNIKKSLYDDEYKITEDEEYLSLPMGYFDIRYDDIVIPMTIEEKTRFYLKNAQREDTNTNIMMTFSAGEHIFLLQPSSLQPDEVARRLDKYVGGKSPWTTPESLYTKFYKILGAMGDWDSVHLEVILSNILRWKEDPHYPARVKYPYNPTTFSIKSLPGVMSWPLGLAFENFGKAITYGMISERGTESPIEKVFFGESLLEE